VTPFSFRRNWISGPQAQLAVVRASQSRALRLLRKPALTLPSRPNYKGELLAKLPLFCCQMVAFPDLVLILAPRSAKSVTVSVIVFSYERVNRVNWALTLMP